MDWSVLRLHSPNVLLRPELVYASHTSVSVAFRGVVKHVSG